MEAVTPIPKIRSGNEFTFVWAIERDGVAEDLTDINITDLQLTVCVGGLCAERVDVPFTIVNTNKIQSSHLYERTGLYNLELTYKKSGVENEIDIDAFRIVARSAEASDSTEFAVSSDMAIAFKGDKGDKGDPFLYTDFTQEQLDDLMKPANDKVADIELLESQIASAEVIRVDNEADRQAAEGLRISAETSRQTAEGLRQTNTATAISNANTATGLANTATTNANTATGLANTATTNANTAATNANEKATLANTAATNADNARLAIQTDLDNASVKMTNLVPNGGFEVGIPLWSGVQPVLSEEEKLSGDKSGYVNVNSNISYSAIDINCNLNDKLYVSIARRFKSDTTIGSHRVAISNYGSITGITNFDVFYKGNLNIWEVSSSIINGRTGGIRLSAGFFSTTVAQYFVDNFIAVNLTETFGVGNEPTKEEFELLLSTLGIDFFEGEITIPAQKVMQWQLKLIRKNKNAIIALGGTII